MTGTVDGHESNGQLTIQVVSERVASDRYTRWILV